MSYTFTSPSGTAGAGSGADSTTEGPLGAGSYKFDASFAGDANYNLAVSGDEPLSINKATITLNTTIYNAADNSVVTGALPLGSSVYDTVSFTGGVAGFTPDLTEVSYTFTSPSGTAGAGSGADSTTEGPLGAGSYKFDASFAGDANYNLAVSGDEPLSINKATITLNTTIYNAANNSVVTGALPLGSSVYDTVSFTGGVAGFTPDLTQVSYTFTSPSGTAGAGSGAQSTTEGPLGAGSYKFDASFAGDANYNLAVSGDEPLSINKATITLNTTIYNAANNSVVTGALPLGSSVYDTVSFTGGVAGFTPDLSQVSYTFTSPSGTAGRVAVPNRQQKGRWERGATSLTLRSPATRTTIWRSAATNHSRSIERRSRSTRRSTTPPTIRWSAERCLWARRCTIRSASPAASRASRPTSAR